MPIRNNVIVVILAAPQICGGKARTEFHTLHGGNAVDDLGNSTLHAAEHGFSHPGGKTGDGAFHNAAHAVAVTLGGGNGVAHPHPRVRLYHREIRLDGISIRGEGIKGRVGNARNGGNVGENLNSHALQPLFAQSSRNAERRGQTAGKVSASGGVLKSAVFDLGGEVRVSGTGAVLQIGVVPGAGVFVVNRGGNGCAAGEAVQNSGEKFRPVGFLSRR